MRGRIRQLAVWFSAVIVAIAALALFGFVIPFAIGYAMPNSWYVWVAGFAGGSENLVNDWARNGPGISTRWTHGFAAMVFSLVAICGIGLLSKLPRRTLAYIGAGAAVMTLFLGGVFAIGFAIPDSGYVWFIEQMGNSDNLLKDIDRNGTPTSIRLSVGFGAMIILAVIGCLTVMIMEAWTGKRIPQPS